MLHLVAEWLGLTNASGTPYLFWSGVGGDVSLVTMAWASWRRHNCHVPWCPRLGRHPVPERGWLVCARHHQGPKPTAAAVAAATTPPEAQS